MINAHMFVVLNLNLMHTYTVFDTCLSALADLFLGLNISVIYSVHSSVKSTLMADF